MVALGYCERIVLAHDPVPAGSCAAIARYRWEQAPAEGFVSSVMCRLQTAHDLPGLLFMLPCRRAAARSSAYRAEAAKLLPALVMGVWSRSSVFILTFVSDTDCFCGRGKGVQTEEAPLSDVASWATTSGGQRDQSLWNPITAHAGLGWCWFKGSPTHSDIWWVGRVA